MEYVLKTKDLKKTYGNYNALNGLSMNVPKGSIYGLIGRNGVGKTTLIRLICGLQKATEGDFSLYGINNHSKEIVRSRKRIGAVVETPSIYLDMSAEDNLKQQYRILGIPSYSTIPDLLKLVGLENTGKKKARNFSLGMRQRLGIAIALSGSPDFLILDEPINGLDPQGIIEIRELILKLNHEHDITVLISSHILDELSRIATHFGFIDKGQMIQEISALELNTKCRKCVKLTVSNMEVLCNVLTEKGYDYSVISDKEIDVFAKLDITSLVGKYRGLRLAVFGWSNRIRTYIVLFLYTGNPRELSMSGNCVGLGLDWNLWKKASTDEFYRQGNGRSYKW